MSEGVASPHPAGAVAGRRTERLADVDRAKGLAIMLVVWGHLSGASTPHTPVWFNVSIATVYTFHMPFFMYLSGFVFFLVGAPDRFWRAPARSVLERANRLLVPFAAFATVVVVGKYAFAGFGAVEQGVLGVADGLRRVVTNAPDNPCLAVWYLVCLFVYSVATPVLWRLGRGTIAVALGLGAAAWFATVPEAYYLHRIASYYVFFAVGGLVALHRDAVLARFRTLFVPALVALAGACYAMIGNPLAVLVCGLIAIPALHGLCLQPAWHRDRAVRGLGRYAFGIYLFNTIVIGLVKALYLPVMGYQGDALYPFLALAFSAALLVPVALVRTLERTPAAPIAARYLR